MGHLENILNPTKEYNSLTMQIDEEDLSSKSLFQVSQISKSFIIVHSCLCIILSIAHLSIFAIVSVNILFTYLIKFSSS